MKIGIDNLKEILRFGLGIGNGIGQGLADGRFELAEALTFLPTLTQLPGVIEAAPAAGQEIADLDADEKTELTAIAVAEFDIPQDAAEKRVEDALKLAFAVLEYVATWVEPNGTTD
jgi:hypothetical protein